MIFLVVLLMRISKLRGVGKKGPVVGVHLINVKGLKLIERDKAESQAMMIMSVDPKVTNFEKCYKDHIFYGSDDSDRRSFLGLKASLLTQK
mmetsp:Transcript_10189/g.20386  ORF Transcript_10189/g.20386 Transcript_10189/m.20386 type:complete len:91 (-) Transcript_10189:171-443(-)